MLNIKLGPLMEAEEARRRICPFSMNASRSEYFNCVADKCTAWMSVIDLPLNMLHGDERDVVMELLADGPESESLGFCCK